MLKLEHIGDESCYQTTVGKSGNISLKTIRPNNQKYSHTDTRQQKKTKHIFMYVFHGFTSGICDYPFLERFVLL